MLEMTMKSDDWGLVREQISDRLKTYHTKQYAAYYNSSYFVNDVIVL